MNEALLPWRGEKLSVKGKSKQASGGHSRAAKPQRPKCFREQTKYFSVTFPHVATSTASPVTHPARTVPTAKVGTRREKALYTHHEDSEQSLKT